LSTKKFFKSLVTGVLVLCALTIVVNLYVNPYSYYGDKSLGKAYIFNAHQAKLNYLKQLKEKPNTYVIGSSNSMRMLPKTIDSLFNVKSFNYGVYQAAVEDFYCVAHAIVEQVNPKTKLIIICIDDWNFRKTTSVAQDAVFARAQNRLAYKTDLSQYLPDYSRIRLFWFGFKSAISWEQLSVSFQKMKSMWSKGKFRREDLKMDGAFYADGVRKKYANEEEKDITQLAESGQYDLTSYLKMKHLEALKTDKQGIYNGSHEDFEEMNEERIELFGQLIAYLNTRNVKVVLNIMPIQPYFKSLVAQYSDYDKRMTHLISALKEIQAANKNVILIQDNSDIKNFNGLENHFFDHIHPTSVNSDRMLYAIRKNIPENALQ
jgi:hypothetical protein